MARRKKRNFHGNSLKNDDPHHLYEIHDKLEDDVFKYGISCDPIDEDGLSGRIRDQVNLGNLFVGWVRFFARILIRNIPGRRKALRIEDETDIAVFDYSHEKRMSELDGYGNTTLWGKIKDIEHEFFTFKPNSESFPKKAVTLPLIKISGDIIKYHPGVIKDYIAKNS